MKQTCSWNQPQSPSCHRRPPSCRRMWDLRRPSSRMIRCSPNIMAFRTRRASTYLKHTVCRTRFLWIALRSIRIRLKTPSRRTMAVTPHFQGWLIISGRIASLEPWPHRPLLPRSPLGMSPRPQASFWERSKMNREDDKKDLLKQKQISKSFKKNNLPKKMKQFDDKESSHGRGGKSQGQRKRFESEKSIKRKNKK